MPLIPIRLLLNEVVLSAGPCALGRNQNLMKKTTGIWTVFDHMLVPILL